MSCLFFVLTLRYVFASKNTQGERKFSAARPECFFVAFSEKKCIEGWRLSYRNLKNLSTESM